MNVSGSSEEKTSLIGCHTLTCTASCSPARLLLALLLLCYLCGLMAAIYYVYFRFYTYMYPRTVQSSVFQKLLQFSGAHACVAVVHSNESPLILPIINIWLHSRGVVGHFMPVPKNNVEFCILAPSAGNALLCKLSVTTRHTIPRHTVMQ